MLIRNVVNSGLDFTADLITDARHQQKISVFALRTNARLSIHYRFFFSCNEFVQSSIRTFVFTENNCSKISPNPIRSSEIIEENLIEKWTHLFEDGFHIRSMYNCNHLKAITTSLLVKKKSFPKR